KCGQRLPSHGCDVAQSSSQATVSYGFRRVPFAPEMDAFQAEVGREQYFVIAGGSQYRTIVADAPDCPGQTRLWLRIRAISAFSRRGKPRSIYSKWEQPTAIADESQKPLNMDRDCSFLGTCKNGNWLGRQVIGQVTGLEDVL